MKVDFTLSGEPGDGDLAAAAELRRYDGIWLPEITHDPFPLLAVAASRTETIELGTAIAVAAWSVTPSQDSSFEVLDAAATRLGRPPRLNLSSTGTSGQRRVCTPPTIWYD